MEKTTITLEEVYQSVLDKLKDTEPGTKEHQILTDTAEQLCNMFIKANESEVNTGIAYERHEDQEADNRFKKRLDIAHIVANLLSIGVSAAGTLLTFVLGVKKLRQNSHYWEEGLKFEETGTFTSWNVKQRLREIR